MNGEGISIRFKGQPCEHCGAKVRAEVINDSLICPNCGVDFYAEMTKHLARTAVHNGKSVEIRIKSHDCCFADCLYLELLWDNDLQKFTTPICNLFKEEMSKRGEHFLRVKGCKQLRPISERVDFKT